MSGRSKHCECNTKDEYYSSSIFWHGEVVRDMFPSMGLVEVLDNETVGKPMTYVQSNSLK